MATGQLSDASLKYFEEKKIKSLLDELLHDVLMKLPADPLTFIHESLQHRTPHRVMVAGPPGCGRSTQCQLLTRAFKLKHISVGDRLNQTSVIKKGSGQGTQLCAKDGTLASDEELVDLIIQEVRAAERENMGWALDGFPQTRSQAIYLQKAGIFPQKFLYLDVSEELAARRIIGRRYNPLTNETYHTEFLPPPDHIQCTADEDDTPTVAAIRLQQFQVRKDEIIECYQPFYVRLDGAKAMEEVHHDIREQLDSLDLPL